MIKTLASIAKIILLSRPVGKPRKAPEGRGLVIMGNGPSLADTIRDRAELLRVSDLMAVNFAANSAEFLQLKPRLYILADPHFFDGEATDRNVSRLWENLGKAVWGITLYVPTRRVSEARRRLGTSVRVEGFNMTPVEGCDGFCDFAYSRGLGMPRPRNVLIPAIMTGLRLGYRTIYLAGADHSWSRTLWVDDKNRVVSIQPHFYPDGEEERDRVAEAYAGIRLHDIYTSFAIAFRSYHAIAAYVSRLNRRAAGRNKKASGEDEIKIINITPGSFIDAFPRG